MSWRYREPQRDEYETDEEYEEALEAYENALDDYCDWVEDRRRKRLNRPHIYKY